MTVPTNCSLGCDTCALPLHTYLPSTYLPIYMEEYWWPEVPSTVLDVSYLAVPVTPVGVGCSLPLDVLFPVSTGLGKYVPSRLSQRAQPSNHVWQGI